MRESDQERLATLLGVYPADLLHALSHAAGGDGRVEAEALLNEARLSAALKRATDVEREFLAFVARLGGEVGPGAADWWLHHRDVAEPNAFVESLAAHGLLFYVPAGRLSDEHSLPPKARGLQIAGKLWTPRAIGERAAAQCPSRSLQVVRRRREPGRHDSWRIIRELFILSRYLTERRPRAARGSGGVGGLAWTDLAKALDEGETATADGGARLKWLVSLAVEAGLVRASDERLAVTPQAAEFFERPPLDQRRLLLEAAVSLRDWNELDPPEAVGLRMSPSVAPGRSDVPTAGNRIRARRHILRVLGELAQSGRWHLAREFGERVIESAPDFLVRRPPPPREDYEPVYRGIERATEEGPAPISTRTGWVLVEGRFVEGFLAGPLYWLGLVDIGRHSDNFIFRLTDMGARVLRPAHEEDARPPGRFFVQPNFEIAADAGGENIGAVVQLSRVAELVSFDRAAVLKITRESVLRALDGGLTHEDIVRILSDGGRVAVPQNVSYSVAEWVAAHERYELRTGVCVVETDEARELDALEKELPGCLERLGPTAARVLPDSADVVAQALERRADVALIDHTEGVSRVFDLDEEMVATPVAERWYWYPEHLLEQIAVRQETGDRPTPTFRLTRESVREGLARGLQATEIERFVEACATRTLTPSQRLLLRGWLGRYPPAQMAPVTVLALPPEAEADALAVPELREQITGRLGPAVFSVRPQGRAKVKRLLERAGIAVEPELPERDPHLRPLSVPQREERRGVWGRRHWRSGGPEGARLELIEEAIEAGLRIEIEYQSVVRGEPPKRWVIGPQAIERSRWGQMRLHAFCYERGTQRVFDVERMTEVRLVEQDGRDDDRIA